MLLFTETKLTGKLNSITVLLKIEFIILSQKRKIAFCFLSQKETAISGQFQLQREEAMASGSL